MRRFFAIRLPVDPFPIRAAIASPALAATVLAFVLLVPPSAAWASDPASMEFFERRIRPVLAEKCWDCHAADAERLRADLQLDHREHFLAGGETGPAIVPGDPGASLLVESIHYGNPDLQMPPKERLAPEVVKDFEDWIAAGAVWPEEAVPTRGELAEAEIFDLPRRRDEHWCWQPVRATDPPDVSAAAWPRQPLDRFVLARLEAEGLRPADEAPRRDWLRRVAFDLTGLPPGTGAMEAFLADDSPEAHERAIDALLASPTFGEHWARRWMDLVRYAETYGHEFDYPVHHAHEYRDYLIRAFNADLPYDLFVTEHLAGDLLAEPRRHPGEGYEESILATAHWFFHEATHAPTDVKANEGDIMDNQLDVFGKAFLGLTVSCARCHDHKFDAISTADYYALSAYLQGSARQRHLVDPQGKRAETRQRQEVLKTQAETHLAERQGGDLAAFATASGSGGVASGETPEDAGPSGPSGGRLYEDFRGGALPEGWGLSGDAFAFVGEVPELRFDADRPLATARTADSGVYGKGRAGELRSPAFALESDFVHVLLKAEKGSVRAVIQNYQMTPFNALLFRGTFENDIDTEGEFRWVTLGRDLVKYRGHRTYLEFADGGEGWIVVDEIRFSDSAEPPPVPTHRASPPSAPALDEGVLALLREGEEIARELPTPRFALAMAPHDLAPVPVHVRGSHRSPGELVPPRFLEALGGAEGDRLELARQVADPANPLTARVLVNRLWHHLFGTGIVATVDDFGPMGEVPSHPELLDWLAADFVEGGWSVKRALRALALSSTYRQSSLAHPSLATEHLAEADPENRLLHRMPVRRLEAESIRDAVLAVSGRLDATRYGPSVPTHRTEFMTGRGARESGPLDGAGRRSVYGAVYRNFMSPFLLAFDRPSPFGPVGRRNISNVPAQALVLLNDPFVAEQSRLWAERVLAEVGDAEGAGEAGSRDEAVVEALYLGGFGRPPEEREFAAVRSFLATRRSEGVEAGESEIEVWADLAHALLNTKDFYFLR